MRRKRVIFMAFILSGGIGLAFQSASGQTTQNPTQPKHNIPEVMPSPESQGAGALDLSPDDIRLVKEALKLKGHDPGPINGTMDSKTRQALREFQKANDLPITGSVDEKTANKLGFVVRSREGAGTSGSNSYTGSQGGSSRSVGPGLPQQQPSTVK